MARYNSLTFLLSKWVLVVIVVMGMIPVIWEIGTAKEGEWFPVVVPLVDDEGNRLPVVVQEEPSPEGAAEPYVDVWVQFNKVRQCEFLKDFQDPTNSRIPVLLRSSLSWYNTSGQRLRVEFDPLDDEMPTTRPVGKQIAGPWRIFGVRTVEDTYAIVAHRCHPLWLTYTKFYP